MIDKLMTDIHAWSSATFPHQTASSKVAHLLEEVNELRDAIKNGHTSDAIEEWADCMILLLNTGVMIGLDAESAVKAIEVKMNINKARKWGKPDKDGVCRHLK